MALTYTPEVQLGAHFPDFHLPGTDGKSYSSKALLNGKPTVVMFICNHCPYVQAIESRLIELGRAYASQVNFIAICSNDATEYPEDAFENLAKRAMEKNYPFPYLHDEDQRVAKLFSAVCTPDLFLYNNKGALIYRGRLDDSWKDLSKVTKKELEKAIELSLKGECVPESEQNPSMGCSIKWKNI
ncbi:MAG: thioredoxin family protein [Bdellovibrionales bacterium]|nr:thioredoxin family protein [Bdellovibrionales bacterium]